MRRALVVAIAASAILLALPPVGASAATRCGSASGATDPYLSRTSPPPSVQVVVGNVSAACLPLTSQWAVFKWDPTQLIVTGGTFSNAVESGVCKVARRNPSMRCSPSTTTIPTTYTATIQVVAVGAPLTSPLSFAGHFATSAALPVRIVKIDFRWSL